MEPSNKKCNTSSLKQNKARLTMSYLTLKQKVELMQDTNEVCLVLFEFYLSKAGYYDKKHDTGFDYMDDAKVAKALHWTKSKVRDNRQQLMRANWMTIIKGKMNNGRKVQDTYLGKKQVLAQNKFENSKNQTQTTINITNFS